jgi:hypothetical protein
MTSTRAWNRTWNYADGLPTGDSRAARLARIDALATLLDSALAIPGTNVRFGVDAIVGLIPGVGDLITALVSLYIVHEARQLGAPTHLLLRMVGNIALDGVVGAAPLVGDVFDVMWRANRRNVALLHDHLRRRGEFAQPIDRQPSPKAQP